MPGDPFLPEDLSRFGKGAYSFFASLIQAGFSEPQALELTRSIITSLLINALRAAS